MIIRVGSSPISQSAIQKEISIHTIHRLRKDRKPHMGRAGSWPSTRKQLQKKLQNVHTMIWDFQISEMLTDKFLLFVPCNLGSFVVFYFNLRLYCTCSGNLRVRNLGFVFRDHFWWAWGTWGSLRSWGSNPGWLREGQMPYTVCVTAPVSNVHIKFLKILRRLLRT